MWKKLINLSKYFLFFLVGAFLFWWVYRDLNKERLVELLSDINYWWIALSIFFSILSNISRAIRWNMLIRPLGYKPSILNTTLAVYVMYAANLLIPRGGEVARCSVLNKYEKAPFTKLVGTVVIERISDAITLLVFAAVILASQFGVLRTFINTHPEYQVGISTFLDKYSFFVIIFGIVALIFFVFFIMYIKRNKGGKLKEIYISFIEGIKAIGRLENKWWYIAHTVFIYIMWLSMLYVLFFCFTPTSTLPLVAAFTTFVISGLAMIIPIQGGIGTWHAAVAGVLVIYGISPENGADFALIAHTSVNLFLAITGIFAVIILPFLNKKKN